MWDGAEIFRLDNFDMIAFTFGWLFTSSMMFLVLAILSYLSSFYAGAYTLGIFGIMQLYFAKRYRRVIEKIKYIEFEQQEEVKNNESKQIEHEHH